MQPVASFRYPHRTRPNSGPNLVPEKEYRTYLVLELLTYHRKILVCCCSRHISFSNGINIVLGSQQITCVMQLNMAFSRFHFIFLSFWITSDYTILLLLHIVGQGLAVLAAGVGQRSKPTQEQCTINSLAQHDLVADWAVKLQHKQTNRRSDLRYFAKRCQDFYKKQHFRRARFSIFLQILVIVNIIFVATLTFSPNVKHLVLSAEQ